MSVDIDQAVERARTIGTMLYNAKSNCPDDERDAELRNLYELAKAAPDGLGVEIGTYKGGSLACWAAAREGRGPIYAVDDNSSKWNHACIETIERYSIDATLLGMTSDDAALIVDDNSVAFLFIDGNHGEGIVKDAEKWPPKLMPSGIIIFHDYGTAKCPLVKQAVDAFALKHRWPCMGQVGSSRAYRRPDSG